MRRLRGVVLVAVLVLTCIGSSYAYAKDCDAIYVDIKDGRIYKSTGACYSTEDTASKNASKLCRRFADDPDNCVAGHMGVDGKGFSEKSACGVDEYIGMACVHKRDRLYCSVGCDGSQEEADLAALLYCQFTHSEKGCELQDVN